MPDDVGNGRPKLVVLAYDAVTIGAAEEVPELVRRIYLRKGSDGSALRLLRNNVVFVVADDARKAEMRRHASRRLALRELRKPERLAHLAEHQRDKVCELEARSEQELALAIQQCYRHVFYPSRHRVESADVDLAHSAIDIHSTSDQPGAGQQHVARALADLNKLRYPEDEPDSPAYVRDRTPLKKGEITTAALRNEFRRDPGLPMLVGDDVFVRGVRLGVEQGEYVYRRGDLLHGPGDPFAEIVIDEQSVVFTMAFAKNRGIWPRPTPDAPEPDSPVPPGPNPPVPPGPDPPVPPPPPPDALTAEGVLRDALTQIWEQARGRGIGPHRHADDSDVRGRRCLSTSRQRRRRAAGGQGRHFRQRVRDPRRGLVPDRVPRAGDRRPARARVPRAAVARRERPEPGGRLRADLHRRTADGRRRGRDLHRTSVPVRRRGRLCVGDGARGRIVMARFERVASVGTPASAPRYELRLRRRGPADAEYAIWQLPAAATPHVAAPTRVAGLAGRNLQLVEHRVLKRLARGGVKLGSPARRMTRGYALTEDLALTLGLLFRVLAPMRSRDNMRAVAEGIEAMGREEAAYWLGMAMHRRRPRRVLTALRMLLTEPRRRRKRSA